MNQSRQDQAIVNDINYNININTNTNTNINIPTDIRDIVKQQLSRTIHVTSSNINNGDVNDHNNNNNSNKPMTAEDYLVLKLNSWKCDIYSTINSFQENDEFLFVKNKLDDMLLGDILMYGKIY